MTKEVSVFEEDKDLVVEVDEETRAVVNRARDAYYEAEKIFPNMDKTTYLTAFLAGYQCGINKGLEMFSELNEHADILKAARKK